ncbi:4Fe-4S binding protein [bacterium]|nr:4Fe-4S binding protein [bacterium]
MISQKEVSYGIQIKEEKCKGCQICINFCPRGVLGISKKINKKGFYPVEVIHKEKCSGCGICFLVCPDVAIEIYGIIDAKSKKKHLVT